MQRLLLNIVFAMALAPLICAQMIRAETVDEIIAQYVQAHGGFEKMQSVKTIRITGKLSEGNFRAAFVQENKRPNRVREEQTIQGMTAIQAYDGKTGWQVSPFSGRKDPDLLSADDMKSLVEDADIDGPLVDYRNKDHRAELVGHDSVEGTDCYKIKLTLANSDVRYYYIDTDSHLEIKVETERNIRGTVHYDETFYGDYEQVNGLYFPFSFETGPKGEADRVTFTVEKVEINVPLSDTQFSMPGVPATGGAVK